MDPQLEQLLKDYKAYFTPEDSGKIKCEVNGHSFPARYDAIAPFVKGAKFLKLKVRYDAEMALAKYEPFIVVSKNFPHMLYCALTGQLLEKSLAAVKKHMHGKRFIKAKERFVKDEQELKAEMDLGPSEDEEDEEGADAMEEEDAEEEDAGGSSDDEAPEFWVPGQAGEDPMDQSQDSSGQGVTGAAGEAAAAFDADSEEMDEDKPGPSKQAAAESTGQQKGKGKASKPAAAGKAVNGGGRQALAAAGVDEDAFDFGDEEEGQAEQNGGPKPKKKNWFTKPSAAKKQRK